jgi:hypothetical protein
MRVENNSSRLRELAARIAIEQDRNKFMELVTELNDLLNGELRKPHDSASPKDA